MLSRARARWQKFGKDVLSSRENKSDANKDAHKVSGQEHMQCVDCFDGGAARQRATLEGVRLEPSGDAIERKQNWDLFEIRPVIDGRLKDIARASESNVSVLD